MVNGADLNLNFPETGTGSRENPTVGHQYQWGSTPASRVNARILGTPAPMSLGIPPNGEAEVKLGEEYAEYAQLLASRLGSTPPHGVSVSVRLVDFSNKVEWVPDRFYTLL
jgi:hypothetical protein